MFKIKVGGIPQWKTIFFLRRKNLTCLLEPLKIIIFSHKLIKIDVTKMVGLERVKESCIWKFNNTNE